MFLSAEFKDKQGSQGGFEKITDHKILNNQWIFLIVSALKNSFVETTTATSELSC